MNTKLQFLLTSRKFWAAVIGVVLMITKAFKPDFPIDEAEITNIVYILVAYIIGTSIETKTRTG